MSPSTPSILISHHQRRYPGPTSAPYRTSSPSSGVPMAIPRAHESVPPPLPPPTYPEISNGRDMGWQWGNDPQRPDFGPERPDFGRQAHVKPGSSLLGGTPLNTRFEEEAGNYAQHEAHHIRRPSSISSLVIAPDQDVKEENRGDAPGSLLPNYRLQGERQLGHRTLVESSQSYDKHLLSRIGGPNAANRLSMSGPHSAPTQESIQLAPVEPERREGPMRLLSMPQRRQPSVDSSTSSRLGPLSPGLPGIWSDHSGHNTRQNSTQLDDASSHRGSYDQSGFVPEDLMEDGQLGNLRIYDRSPRAESLSSLRAGSKRRASSPPREQGHEDRSSVSSASGHSEIYHRRSLQHLPNRGSPISRFHPSASPTSSLGPRHGSLGSSLGVSSMPSSTTSYGSGRVSPHGASPAMDSDVRNGPMYGTPNSAFTSHSRTYSEASNGRKVSTDSVAHSRHSSLSNQQGVYLCECCPKKPKKFDTAEQLKSHEAEKQYTCAYCPNRFKNKNEAERHQNSLHLRRHSWSCAVLSGVEAVFHPSVSNDRDVCGYCGVEFPNPPQWDMRRAHLHDLHKFGECNQTKKFFRADHFRQHLKHSHAGSSGKWTNMLENACMKDEPPPEKRIITPAGQPTSGLAFTVPAEHPIPETPHDT